jgi:hypothetical protein
MGVWPGLDQREAPARVSAMSQAQMSFLRQIVVLFTLRGFAPLQPRPPDTSIPRTRRDRALERPRRPFWRRLRIGLKVAEKFNVGRLSAFHHAAEHLSAPRENDPSVEIDSRPIRAGNFGCRRSMFESPRHDVNVL